MDRNLETICTAPHHGLTIYQVSAWSDAKCTRSYPEMKSLQMVGQTDAEGHNIIWPFFLKRAYKKDTLKITVPNEDSDQTAGMLRFVLSFLSSFPAASTNNETVDKRLWKFVDCDRIGLKALKEIKNLFSFFSQKWMHVPVVIFGPADLNASNL